MEQGVKLGVSAPAPAAPTISVARAGTNLTVTFVGTLQAADKVTGPWTDVTGSSPQTITPAGAQKFYRATR